MTTSINAPASHVAAEQALPPIAGLSGTMAADRRLTLTWTADPAYAQYEVHESTADPAHTFKETVSASQRVSGQLKVRSTPLRYGVRGRTGDGTPGPFSDAVEVLVRESGGTVTVTGEPFASSTTLPPPQVQPPVTGRKPRDVIESIKNKRWKLNLDVNASGEHSAKKGQSVEKDAKTLADGFAFEKHFDVVEDGPAVRFRSHVEGTTTGGSDYPRTELREMKSADSSEEADWGTADSAIHRLTAWVKVTRTPTTSGHQGVVIGQIHDKKDDVLEIMYDGEKKAVGYRWDGKWQKDDLLIPDYSPGEAWFGYRIEVQSKTVRIAIDTGDGFQTKVTRTNVTKTKCYFKAGAYTQSSLIKKHGATEGDFGEALFRSIVVDGG